MKENYALILNEIKSGQPYKLTLNDGATFEFEKQGLNRYKLVLRDSSGSKKKKVVLKESGLVEMFEKFEQKATHIDKIVH